MAVTKTKISVTVSSDLVRLLEAIAKSENLPKSNLVERSLQKMIDERMEKEAEIIAKTQLDDIATEEEWQKIEPDWPEWKE